MSKAPDIFGYLSYRDYLRDYYSWKKTQQKGFSHRFIASQVGFKSSGLFAQILSGQTNLAFELIEKFVTFLDLRPREAEYFRGLVQFEKAKSHQHRKEALDSLTAAIPPYTRQLEKDQYEYYSKWYHCAIRAMVGILEPNVTVERIAELLNPKISSAKVKRSLKLLEILGLIVLDEKGGFKVSERHLTTGDKLRSTAVILFQQQMLDLAKKALAEQSPEFRHGSTMTLGLSKEAYKKVMEITESFRAALVELAEKENNPARVYQIGIQAFPLSESIEP